MADKAWKALERRVAKLFGCTRRGPIFRSADGGTDDCTSERYAIECKLLAKPTYGAMQAACFQAELAGMGLFERAASGEPVTLRKARTPIAVVKRKRDRDADALVCMRLETFLQWQAKGE